MYSSLDFKKGIMLFKLLHILKKCLGEIIVIFALIFSINNYFGNEDKVIVSDGKGYYDYLPAIFIYGDLPVCNNSNNSAPVSDRINKTDFYAYYENSRVNKYSSGTAILLFPFFVYAHLSAPIQGFPNDGFSEPYQKATFWGALFYLFLALFFLRKLLSFYISDWRIVFMCQVLIVFSSSVISYANGGSTFSHIYSLFAITAFLYFTKSFFATNNLKYFFRACCFLGLIIIIRQLNVMILLFVPFIAHSFQNLKQGILYLFKNKIKLIAGIILFFGVLFIQSCLWYYQTGHFIIYSYQNEYFNFLSPHFVDILFSYRKGLFIYTPIMIFSFVGVLVYIKEKKQYLALCWTFFFLLLTFVLSSWWCWDFGCSYGLRAYIDYYAVFCIAIAIAIERTNGIVKIILIVFICLTIPLNMIQTWQYKNYIIHWSEMDKQKYWEIFLRTEKRFAGLVWKKHYAFTPANCKTMFSAQLNNVSYLPHTTHQLYSQATSDITNYNSANYVQIQFDNYFNSEDDTHLEFFIQGKETNNLYWKFGIPIIRFSEKELNKEQTGEVVYELPKLVETENKNIVINVITEDKEVVLKNIKISFLKYIPNQHLLDIENNIRNDKEIMKKEIEKAKEHNISLDDMIKADANWIFDNERNIKK